MYKKFKNSHCLEMHSDDCNLLDLKQFPEINDFTIKFKVSGVLGYHIYFSSKKYGDLASFPWYDNIDKELQKMSIDDIYNGTIDNPFNDLEQGWKIIIFTKNNYVYILQGDSLLNDKYTTWFKIDKEIYFKEWEKILKQARELG